MILCPVSLLSRRPWKVSPPELGRRDCRWSGEIVAMVMSSAVRPRRGPSYVTVGGRPRTVFFLARPEGAAVNSEVRRPLRGARGESGLGASRGLPPTATHGGPFGATDCSFAKVAERGPPTQFSHRTRDAGLFLTPTHPLATIPRVREGRSFGSLEGAMLLTLTRQFVTVGFDRAAWFRIQAVYESCPVQPAIP